MNSLWCVWLEHLKTIFIYCIVLITSHSPSFAKRDVNTWIEECMNLYQKPIFDICLKGSLHPPKLHKFGFILSNRGMPRGPFLSKFSFSCTVFVLMDSKVARSSETWTHMQCLACYSTSLAVCYPIVFTKWQHMTTHRHTGQSVLVHLSCLTGWNEFHYLFNWYKNIYYFHFWLLLPKLICVPDLGWSSRPSQLVCLHDYFLPSCQHAVGTGLPLQFLAFIWFDVQLLGIPFVCYFFSD